MSEILRKINIPMEDGNVRELLIPDLLHHLADLKFVSCTPTEFHDIETPDERTVYFIFNRAGLFKIYLGPKEIWFCSLPYVEWSGEVNRIEIRYKDVLGGPDIDITVRGLGESNILYLDRNNKVTDLKFQGAPQEVKICGRAGKFLLVEGYMKKIDLSKLDTSELGSMYFAYSSLISLDLRHIDLSQLKNLYSTFKSCRSLEWVDFSYTDLRNLDSLVDTFSNCTNLKKVIFPSEYKLKPRIYSGFFTNCSSLEVLDLSMFEMNSLTLDGCSNLTDLKVDSIIRTHVQLKDSPLLSHESVIRIIECMNEIKWPYGNLQIHENVYNKLTQEEIAYATSKNITIIY